MDCPDCIDSESEECLRCDGKGSLCRACGEAAEDTGLDYCYPCSCDPNT